MSRLLHKNEMWREEMVDRSILQQCTYPGEGMHFPILTSSMYYLTWPAIVPSRITRNFWHTKMVNRVTWFALTSMLYKRSQVLNTWAKLFQCDRSSQFTSEMVKSKRGWISPVVLTLYIAHWLWLSGSI